MKKQMIRQHPKPAPGDPTDWRLCAQTSEGQRRSATPQPVTVQELIEIVDALDEGKDFANLLLMACEKLSQEDASPMCRGIGLVLGQINAARKVAALAQQRLIGSPALRLDWVVVG